MDLKVSYGKSPFKLCYVMALSFAFRRTIGDGNGMSLTNPAGAAEAREHPTITTKQYGLYGRGSS
jgi:hypothetical protein